MKLIERLFLMKRLRTLVRLTRRHLDGRVVDQIVCFFTACVSSHCEDYNIKDCDRRIIQSFNTINLLYLLL